MKEDREVVLQIGHSFVTPHCCFFWRVPSKMREVETSV